MALHQEEMACRICGNQEGNTFYTAREMMYGLRHEFPYFQCGKCHCLQIREFPEDMSPYYPDDYYSFHAYNGKKFRGLRGVIKKQQYCHTIFGYPIIQKTLDLFVGKNDFVLLRNLNLTWKSRVLDVGCGNGRSFLYPLAEIGFEKLLGCDPYLKQSISYPNGLVIQNTEVFDVTGQWDLITYHHAFEHVPDPLEQMQKVAQLLTNGGICILRVPTVSSYAWEHYRTNWAQLDAPRHFFLHSRESMQILAERTGLELYRIEYDSTHFQFSGSEKYVHDIPLSAPRPIGFGHFVKRKLKKINYIRRAKTLNREGRGDQAAFFFRKP